MKVLLIKEINIFKDSTLKSTNNSHLTNLPNSSKLFQEQIWHLQKQLKYNDNLIQSLLTKLSQQLNSYKNRSMSYKEKYLQTGTVHSLKTTTSLKIT